MLNFYLCFLTVELFNTYINKNTCSTFMTRNGSTDQGENDLKKITKSIMRA